MLISFQPLNKKSLSQSLNKFRRSDSGFFKMCTAWWYVGMEFTLLDVLYFINMGLWFFNIFDTDWDFKLRCIKGHGERRSFEIGLRDVSFVWGEVLAGFIFFWLKH